MPPAPIIDLKRFSIVAETPAEAREILDLFYQHTQKKLAFMQTEMGRNAAEWLEAIHYIKGSAANLGMDALTDLCKQAEQYVTQDRTQQNELIKDITHQLDVIKIHMKTVITETT